MNIKTCMLTACLLVGALCANAANPKPFTVPEVSAWKGGEGTFKPSTTSRIVAAPGSEEALRIAQMLGQDYTTISGTSLPVLSGKAAKGDISLRLKADKKAAPESYSLGISPTGVTITSPTPQGLYWGTRTLLQLIENSADGASIPVGTIADAPAYGKRGFMLDAGRKYMPLSYLYALVDALSYYKMNTLHIHLNDNGFKYYYDNNWDKTQAAFRMESDKFPGLTARDGSYTKKEFADLVRYAESKGVNIIPEFDFPAHSLAFSRYKPEIGSADEEYGRDHLDLMQPATYEFLDTLIAEYLEGPEPAFPGPIFHIGTDEYSNRDSVVVEKFRYLTDRYIKYVEKFGKRPAVWGALSHAKGKTPVKSDNVLMYCWYNGYAQPVDMFAQGYNLISIPDGWVYIVPKAGYYQDYLDTEKLYKQWTPANIGGHVFSGDTLKQIEGGMFALWNDHPSNGITVKDVAHRVQHALPTMAAKTWSADKVTFPYEEFIDRSSKMMEAPGVNYLGRAGKPGVVETVLEIPAVTPGMRLPLAEIGYDYTVEFDVEGAPEEKGTVLFESPNATFWLSDPVEGNMAFSREADLNAFRYNVLPGEKIHVKVTGNNETTRLYVDGKLIDDLNVLWLSYNDKNKIARVRTLVFPLDKAGRFNSKVSNLRVVNAFEQ